MSRHIKNFFAVNGKIRNVIFVISFSLGIVLTVTYLFIGHKFLYMAPALIIATLIGLYFKPPKYYLPFCAGALLQFGLFAALMGYLIAGPGLPVFVDLFIGCVGYALLVTSIWQAVFGEWNLPRWADKAILIFSILGLALSLFVVATVEYRGIQAEPSPHYRTY